MVYQCLIDNIIENNKPYIFGFSLIPFNFEEHIYNKNLKYGNPSLNQIQRSGHNEETEIKKFYYGYIIMIILTLLYV